MSSRIDSQRTGSFKPIEPDAQQQPVEIHGQGNSSERPGSGALIGVRQVAAPLLQPGQVPVHAAPTAESVWRRDHGVLTEQGLRATAGAPKERRSFLGLFRFGGQRSQEYRRVLRSVAAFSQAAHDDTQSVTGASVDAAIAQLDQVSVDARAYVEGRGVLSRKSHMRQLLTDVEQEKAALEQLKWTIEQGLGLPPNISLRDLLPYLRRGVAPDVAIQCCRDGTDSFHVTELASDNAAFVGVASWMLARSHEHLNWHDDGALLKIASVLVDFGVSRGDLDALDRVLGQPSNLDEVTERIDLVEHVLGALPDDDSVPPGAIAQLLGVIQSAAPSLLQSVDAAAVQALLTGLLPVMLEHPDLPACIESGLSVGMSLQNAIDWARQPQGQTPPNLQGALAYQRARVAAFGTADGASRARWQALGLRLQTDDAFRSRVRDLTLGLSPGLQRSLPLAQAVLFAEHAYSNDQIRVWLDSGTGVSDVLLTAPLQADQVQGPTRKLGSGAFNTVLAVRYGDDAASAREYAFKPLQASDKTGISLRCAGVRKGDPQVLARNMASAELARRLGMAGLIPDSRPGFYRNSQGELQLGVVMGLANSELADKKTRLREEDISDSSDAAGVYLQATAQLGGAHAMMYPGFEFKRIRQKQAAFDELRKRYPNLTQESDLQIREVNGARRLFATVSRYLVPDPAQADPALQEAVMGLQLLDYLLLQVDRHLSNFMIQRDATGATRGVVGFDNDQCLGTAAHPNQLLGLAPRLANGKMGPAHFLGRPPLLSEQQIQALQNFDAQDYRLWLEIAGFSPAVIAAFDYRLSTLRSEAQAAAALGAPAARADGLRKVTAFDEASRDWLLGHGRSLAQPGWLYDNPLWRLKRTTAFEKRAMVDYLRL